MGDTKSKKDKAKSQRQKDAKVVKATQDRLARQQPRVP
jgi:hypothetical protein